MAKIGQFGGNRFLQWLGALLLALTVIGMEGAIIVFSAESKSFDEALKLFEQEKFPQAQRMLEGLVTKDSNDFQSRILLGWSLWSMDRYDEALFQFKTVLREAPETRMAKMGERKTGFGDGAGEATLINNPDLISTRKGLGWTYFKKGWPRLALEQFQILNQMASSWDEPYLGLGYSYLALGDFKRSEEAFQNYLKNTNSAAGTKKPHEGERGLGELYATQGQYAKSIPHLESALQGKPDWVEAQQLLAWSDLRTGKISDARNLFTKIKGARPIEAEAGLAWIALQADRFDEAEVGFAKALALAPAHAAALEGSALLRQKRYKNFDAAWGLYYAGKYKEAVDAFTMLDQNPGSLPELTRLSVQIGLGSSRLALKDLAGAELTFRTVLRKDSKQPDARAGLGWIAVQKKKWEEAEQAFTEALKIAPQLPSPLEGLAAIRAARYQAYDRAWGLFYEAKYAEAASAFDALVSQPGDLPKQTIPYAKTGSGWALIEMGQLDKAEEKFRAVLGESKDAAGEAKAGLGWVALRRKQLDQANKLFTEALTAMPGHQAALRGRTELRKILVPDLDQAWALYNQGKFAEAISGFEKIQTRQDIAEEYRREALRGHAWSLYFRQQYDEALNLFAKLGGNEADSLEGQGLTLFKMGRQKDAIAPLAKASELLPLSADYLLALGWAELRSGDTATALATFQKAYALAPASAEINRSLGWAYAKTNQPAQALAAFRYALGLLPGEVADKEFRTLITQTKEYRDLGRDLAWAYAKWHAFEPARREFESLLSSQANDPDLLFGLGSVLYMEGKLSEAERALKKSISERKISYPQTRWVNFRQAGSYPVLSDAQTLLGWVAFAKKEYREAEKQFMTALKREPEMVDAMVGLAASLGQGKKMADAREIYLRAVEIYPQYPAVLAGLRETQSATVNRPGGGGHDAASTDKR